MSFLAESPVASSVLGAEENGAMNLIKTPVANAPKVPTEERFANAIGELSCIEDWKAAACIDRLEAFLGREISADEAEAMVCNAAAIESDYNDLLRTLSGAAVILPMPSDRGVLGDHNEVVFDTDEHTDYWRGKYERLVAEAPQRMAASEKERGAVASILALEKGESYLEPGRGPCVNGAGEHDLATGYMWFEWRVRVINDGSERQRYKFVIETRSDHNLNWSATDFGMGCCEANREQGFEWCVDAERVGPALKAMRGLRDLEEAEYDDPKWREAQGVTDDHLRTGTLSASTIAELEAEADLKVAA